MNQPGTVIIPPADPCTPLPFERFAGLVDSVARLQPRFNQLTHAVAAFREKATRKVTCSLMVGSLPYHLSDWGDLYGDVIRLATTELRHDIDEMIGGLAACRVEAPDWLRSAVRTMDGWSLGVCVGTPQGTEQQSNKAAKQQSNKAAHSEAPSSAFSALSAVNPSVGSLVDTTG